MSVVIEEPAKTLTSANSAVMFHCGSALDQLVLKALVIPLTVIMFDELGDRPA